MARNGKYDTREEHLRCYLLWGLYKPPSSCVVSFGFMTSSTGRMLTNCESRKLYQLGLESRIGQSPLDLQNHRNDESYKAGERSISTQLAQSDRKADRTAITTPRSGVFGQRSRTVLGFVRNCTRCYDYALFVIRFSCNEKLISY